VGGERVTTKMGICEPATARRRSISTGS